MKKNKLNRSFYERSSITVAKELLGTFLIRKVDDRKIIGKIIETEAYGDANDLASHARFGQTNRNKVMFGPAGMFYVYSIYGIFNLTNVICGKEGSPGAVLIRSAEIIEGETIAINNLKGSKFVKISENLATGPGKLSIAFHITKENNLADSTLSDDLYLVEGEKQKKIVKTSRIGIDYAAHCKDYKWRFYIKDNPFVSKL